MKKLSALYVLVFCLATSATIAHEWKIWGSLQKERAFGYVAAVSPTSAIVIGGFPDYVHASQHFGSYVTRSCEIIDIATGTVRYTDSTAVGHADGPIVRMSSGNIVVLGGVTDGHQGLTQLVEEFDPLTETWSTKGNLLYARRQQQAIALDDHRIMIACGRDASLRGTNIVEIFDLATGLCTRIADYPEELTNHKLMMADSSVHLIGGRESGPGSRRGNLVYRYNEINDTWDRTYDLATAMPLLEGIQVYDGMYTSGGSVDLFDSEFSDAVYVTAVEHAELRDDRALSIQPSPSSDAALLLCNSNVENAQLSIYDVTGALLWRKSILSNELLNGVQLPALQMRTGVYTVRITMDSGSQSINWIVQH